MSQPYKSYEVPIFTANSDSLSKERGFNLNGEPINGYQHVAKVILIGDSSTGKSSLFNRMIGRGFCSQIPSTIGVDFHSLGVRLDMKALPSGRPDLSNLIVRDEDRSPRGLKRLVELHDNFQSTLKRADNKNVTIKLQIWDAAGQEKFKKIVKGFYRNTSVILLVFDLSNPKSFENLTIWVEEIIASDSFEYGFPMFFLVGNKSDLAINPNALEDKITNFCKKYNIISYHALSAKVDDQKIMDFITVISHEFYLHAEFIQHLNYIDLNRYLLTNSNNRLGIGDDQERKLACCQLL